MKKVTVLLFLSIVSIVSAQRYNILSGDFKNLKGISEYNATFDYKDLQVNGFESEEAYLKEKAEKRQNYDNGKDIDGKAEKFKNDWYADRQNKYEPAFINYFNSKFEKDKVVIDNNRNAKYTMNIKTTWIYPGYSVVAAAEPAKISAIITVTETANPKNILLEIEFDKSIGLPQGTFDFNQGYRIAGAYEKLAKNMAIQLKRFL